MELKGPFVPEPAFRRQEAVPATEQELVVGAHGEFRVAVAVADQLLIGPGRRVAGAQGSAVPDRVVVRVIGDVQVPPAVAHQRRAAVVVVRLADGVGRRPTAARAVEGANPHAKPFGDRVEPSDVHRVAERDDLVFLRVRGGATAPAGGEELTCHWSLHPGSYHTPVSQSGGITATRRPSSRKRLKTSNFGCTTWMPVGLCSQVLDSVALRWRMNHGEFGALSGQAAG